MSVVVSVRAAFGHLLYARGIIPAPLQELRRERSGEEQLPDATRRRRRASAASRRRRRALQRIDSIAADVGAGVMEGACRVLILIGSSATRPRECFEIVLPAVRARAASAGADAGAPAGGVRGGDVHREGRAPSERGGGVDERAANVAARKLVRCILPFRARSSARRPRSHDMA